MENSKIKNITIIILLAVNIFFLALFLIGRAESGKIEKQSKEDIVIILAANGISFDVSKIPANSDIGYYKLTRNLESEKLIADTLLGTNGMKTVGGNIYQYENVLGKATFRGNGEFEIDLPSGKAFEETSTAALATYLKDMNIIVDGNPKTNSYGEAKTVTFNCKFNKDAIFNCQIVMQFNSDKLISLSGRRLISEPQNPESKIMSVKTALISFLNEIKGAGTSCNKINGISPGYVLSGSATGNVELIPSWRVETDIGSYYVNGLTGKISASFD